MATDFKLTARDIEDFKQNIWHKKAKLFKNAFDPQTISMSKVDFLSMGTDPDINARCIIKNNNDYQLIKDQLTDKHFQTTHFTLFIQEMDQLFDELFALKKALPFIPMWRFDDIMGSFSTPYSGPGPHLDFYDVFILQVHGEKKWTLEESPRNFENISDSDLTENEDIKILKNFNACKEYILTPGDLLYVPTRLAHHPEAVTESFSYSIGLRSPLLQDILDQTKPGLDVSSDLRMEENLVYQNQYEVPKDLLKSIKNLPVKLDATELEDSSSWLGSLITYHDHQAEFSYTEDKQFKLDFNQKFEKDLSVQMAYSMDNQDIYLFINGDRIIIDKENLKLVQYLCEESYYDLNDIQLSKEQTIVLNSIIHYMLKNEFIQQVESLKNQ